MNNNLYCNICNKFYKNINSFGNHKRKYHYNDGLNFPDFCENFKPNNKFHNKYLNCEYCNKIISRKDNLKRHIKICKAKIYYDIEKKLKDENEKLKIIIKEDKEDIKKMKEDLELLKINISANNTTNNNTANNNTNNNFQQNNHLLIQLGKENVINVLPKSDQIKILNTCYNSLYRLIKEIHCNDKYPQFKNISITNLTDGYAQKYDDKVKNFIKCHKNEVIEYLIDNRILDIEDLLNANIDDIDEEKVKKLHILIEEINDKRGCYKDKKEQIKLLLYNESKKKK